MKQIASVTQTDCVVALWYPVTRLHPGTAVIVTGVQ